MLALERRVKMKITITITENKEGYSWKVEGGDVTAGGNGAKTRKSAKIEAKDFCLSMCNAEKFNLDTDTVHEINN